MGRWLIGRGLHALLTLAVAACILFFLMRIVPGDPLSRLSDDRPITPHEIAQLRARYGSTSPSRASSPPSSAAPPAAISVSPSSSADPSPG
jgi:ABC-type dipeptide/oligopeptide/nickel transport systems, permease components